MIRQISSCGWASPLLCRSTSYITCSPLRDRPFGNMLLENVEDEEESTKLTGGAVCIAGAIAAGGTETSGVFPCEDRGQSMEL